MVLANKLVTKGEEPGIYRECFKSFLGTGKAEAENLTILCVTKTKAKCT